MKASQLKSEPKLAKLFQNGGSQAVRLPKEFRFEGECVEVSREGDRIIITPVKTRMSWAEYFSRPSLVPDDAGDLMDGIKDLPPLSDKSCFDE